SNRNLVQVARATKDSEKNSSRQARDASKTEAANRFTRPAIGGPARATLGRATRKGNHSSRGGGDSGKAEVANRVTRPANGGPATSTSGEDQGGRGPKRPLQRFSRLPEFRIE